jgi:hypothetical protein
MIIRKDFFEFILKVLGKEEGSDAFLLKFSKIAGLQKFSP